mgnify:CR=1 FL=1
MSNNVKGFFIVVVTIIIVGGIITGVFFLTHVDCHNDESKQKSATKFSPLNTENTNTAGNWTFIPTSCQDSPLLLDVCYYPKILDKFEREHSNLSIRDWKIVYYDTYPFGILIWHTSK